METALPTGSMEIPAKRVIETESPNHQEATDVSRKRIGEDSSPSRSRYQVENIYC